MPKQKNCLFVVSLLLLALVCSSVWAADAYKYKEEPYALVLPKVGEDMAKHLSRIDLTVAIVDSDNSTKQFLAEKIFWLGPHGKTATAKNQWINANTREAISELNLPIYNKLPDPRNPKLQYQLQYELTPFVKENLSIPSQKAVEYIPIRNGDSFRVSAPPLPFELLVVDVSGLQFVDPKTATNGLAMVKWQINHGEGQKIARAGTASLGQSRETHIPVGKKYPAKATIYFQCLNPPPNRSSTISWEGNGQNLQGSGLNIVLSSPCTK